MHRPIAKTRNSYTGLQQPDGPTLDVSDQPRVDERENRFDAAGLGVARQGPDGSVRLAVDRAGTQVILRGFGDFDGDGLADIAFGPSLYAGRSLMTATNSYPEPFRTLPGNDIGMLALDAARPPVFVVPDPTEAAFLVLDAPPHRLLLDRRSDVASVVQSGGQVDGWLVRRSPHRADRLRHALGLDPVALRSRRALRDVARSSGAACCNHATRCLRRR